MRSLKSNQRITGSVRCQLKRDLNLKVYLPTLAIARAFQHHEVEITVVCFPVVNDVNRMFMTQPNRGKQS